jgi:hypothetical protein
MSDGISRRMVIETDPAGFMDLLVMVVCKESLEKRLGEPIHLDLPGFGRLGSMFESFDSSDCLGHSVFDAGSPLGDRLFHRRSSQLLFPKVKQLPIRGQGGDNRAWIWLLRLRLRRWGP